MSKIGYVPTYDKFGGHLITGQTASGIKVAWISFGLKYWTAGTFVCDV